MYYNKYDKYKNKYINILLNKLLLNEKLKLLYYLYQDKIIYTLYKYIYNDNIYNINTKVVKLSKFNILYKLLIVQSLI